MQNFSFGKLTLGHSQLGAPLEGELFGGEADSPRILIIAGQHGDERRASRAAERFASDKAARLAEKYRLQIAVVPWLNPDGAASRKRANAAGIDLNRDHQRLRAPETRALHQFVRAWRPQLVVDVHMYPSRRRHLMAQGWRYCHDIFLETPTNPTWRECQLARSALPQGTLLCASLLTAVTERLQVCGILGGRYTMIRPSGRVRHGTPDVVDARNALALRYSLLSVLIEGRHFSQNRTPEQEREHLKKSLVEAICEVVAWAGEERAALECCRPEPPHAEFPVPIASRYVSSSGAPAIAMRSLATGQTSEVTFAGKYSHDTRVTERVALPRGYLVPQTHQRLLQSLAAHGFAMEKVSADLWRRHGEGSLTCEAYCVARAKHSARSGRPPRKMQLTIADEALPLTDYVFISAQQMGGEALAVFLEPLSKYGLHRFEEMNLTLRVDHRYPILRVVTRNAP